MDRNAQMDELESLKSIYYPEEFQVTNKGDHNKEIQAIFWAFNKLPDDYIIKYLEVPGSHDPLYLKVKHLPPIELRLTFPEDYPSKSPPNFFISCQWLPREKISVLCKKLDELWSEYGPVEIVYIWCDFLKNDALTILGCDNELDLRELCSKHLTFLQKFETQKTIQGNIVSEQKITPIDSSTFMDIANNTAQCQVTAPNEKENNCTPGTSEALLVKNVKAFKENHNKFKKDHPYHRENDQKKLNATKKLRSKNKLDDRAILDLNIKTSPIKLLEKYNAEREIVHFLRTFYTCKICFSDKLGKDCTKFQGCNHVFCIECIKMYFTVKIKDGSVQSIICPEDDCSTEASPTQVKEIVSRELFAKYDAALLNTALDTLSDIIYCPRQMCQYPVSWEPKEKMASCPNCQYVFCVTCKMVYHGIEPCQFKSAEVKKLIEKYEGASKELKAQMESKYGKKHLETLVNNTKAESWIKDNTKSCPKCEVAIEKAHGCNKMVCWKCNAFFCWLCGAVLDGKNPYIHYSDPNSKCVNKLFYLVYDVEDEDEEWDWVDENEDEILDTDYDEDDDLDINDDYDDDENDLNFLASGPIEF